MKKINALMVGVSMLATFGGTPASGATITWEDSGVITSVSSGINNSLPGLTVGTPWSLRVSFDPNGPATAWPSAGSNCNSYDMGATTFTLGGSSYTHAGGNIYTNAILPQFGCYPTTNGAIVFEWQGGWTQEPGAWDLNQPLGLLFFQYVDTVHNDGTLPTTPSIGIDGFHTAFAPGLTFYSLLFDYPFPTFQSHPVSPSLAAEPVPEPGTLAMLTIGLAYGARKFRRQRSGARLQRCLK